MRTKHKTSEWVWREYFKWFPSPLWVLSSGPQNRFGDNTLKIFFTPVSIKHKTSRLVWKKIQEFSSEDFVTSVGAKHETLQSVLKRIFKSFYWKFFITPVSEPWDPIVGFEENFSKVLSKVFMTHVSEHGPSQRFHANFQQFSSKVFITIVTVMHETSQLALKKKFINHFFTPISVERLKVGFKRGFYKNNFHQLYFFFTPLSVKRSQIEFEESFYKKIS